MKVVSLKNLAIIYSKGYAYRVHLSSVKLMLQIY